MRRHLLFLICAALLSETIAAPPPVAHRIEVTQPGLPPAEPLFRTLFSLQDEAGRLAEYYLDVPSVICGDSVCEIITVRLSWDPLGKYIRYTLPEGGALTKKGHVQFTPEDSAKLQTILADPNSPLSSVDPSAIVSPADVAPGEDEVDGVSGATALTDKSVIVSGAVYTCYTLWHWVNGTIQQTIRGLSAAGMGREQLLEYLGSGNDRQEIFAIEQLAARRIHDAPIAEAVFGLLRTGSRDLIAPGLAYFESIGAAAYYDAVEKLFDPGKSSSNVLLLSALTSTGLEAPAGFYERLSRRLAALETYQEVHILLGLLTYHGEPSAEVIAHTVPLLENRSFLIGRKAYYFLKNQPLTPEQAGKLEDFRSANAARL